VREKVLLLHGWGGSDYPHWQSWIAGEIAKDYGQVAFPLLDQPHFPTKNRWMKQVKAASQRVSAGGRHLPLSGQLSMVSPL